MPVTYEIDKARGVIWTRCIGIATLDEMLGHFRELEQDPDCPESLDVLLDLTEMESVPASGQLRTVTEAMGRIYQRVHFNACAIVAPRDVLFGMMRMWEVFAGEQFRVSRTFRDLGEARAWLTSPQAPPA
jgi:hypothetical protein